MDLVVENWIQLISDRNAAYFIRTLTYHLVGIKRNRSEEVKDVFCDKIHINQSAKENFERIATVALDYGLMNG